MITRDYFSHTIPGYGKVWDKLHAIGYCYVVAGENIGWNTYPDDTATAAIQDMFMGSPGHRANILGKTWDVVGIGAYKGPTGKKMWTVLFADKCGSTAPKATPRPTARPKPKPPPARPRARPSAPTPRPTPRKTPKPRRHARAERQAARGPDLRADASDRRREPPARRRSGPGLDRRRRTVRRAVVRRRPGDGRDARRRPAHEPGSAGHDRRRRHRVLLRRLTAVPTDRPARLRRCLRSSKPAT